MLQEHLFPTPWLTNTLLDEGFIATKKAALGQQAIPCALSDWLAQHFNTDVLAKLLAPTEN